MTTEQIYGIVNSVAQQGIGSSALTVVDEQGLISLGNEVLSSETNREGFINTLVQRIGRTIFRFREYSNKLSGLLLDDMEYGAIVQKIRVAMPEAIEDPAYNLQDGKSVDPWVVKKPRTEQKLFVTRTPYMYQVTVQEIQLKEAFLSADAMGRFISSIFGELRNKIEYDIERLGRNAINNMIAECYTSAGAAGQSVVNLGTLYREINANAPTTPAALLNDNDFLRFAVSTMNTRVDMIQEMSVLNMPDSSAMPTFTTKDRMYVYIMSQFKRRLETVVQYGAFHDTLVDVRGNESLTYLQSQKSPLAINVERASDGTAVNVDNIVGMIYDRDACGTYMYDEYAATTPLNARGLYYNSFYHLKQLWFNDLQENFVVFTLN